MSRIVIPLLILFALLPPPAEARSGNEVRKFTVSGTIKDARNGEDLIGATVYIREINTGAQTNVYGFYSLSLEEGSYVLEFRYVGYSTVTKTLELQDNVRMDVELNPDDVQLEEVVILGTAADRNITRVDMSVNELDIATIRKVPALLGEVDIIKSIQLLPGVSSVGEGASGFNVRGGDISQNLVLLDEAPVYNASHLLGFFSVFNPDVVKDVKLYKGAIPARYGGRLASVLDIRLKEGNDRKFGATGGIGTIFSRLTLEAPLVKNRASFVVSARRSYIDVFAKAFTDVLSEGAALNFYDLTMKTHYDISKRDQIYLSGYFGRDVFKFDAQQGFSWGNKTASLRWNHLFSDRLFANTTVFYSDYDYQLAFGEDNIDKFEWNSRIRTFNVKPELTYYLNPRNLLTFGGDLIYYRFNPAEAFGISNGETAQITLDKKYAVEAALYAGNEQEFSDRFSMQYGLRASMYWALGPGTFYEYADAPPGRRRPPSGSFEVGAWESAAQYFNLEPRISARLQLDPASSIKASYNRTAQYIHLISNTTASNPLDVWSPSSNNLRPQTGDQWALGYFRNFGGDKIIETSVEAYYRNTRDQVEYIDGADLLINEFLEGELLSGIGRAYGLEFLVRRNSGKLNGWVSYTVGRTELRTEGINNGSWYPTRFDQLHNLKIAGFYEISDRWTLSANFTYLSGTPATFPTSRFEMQEYLVPHNALSTRNNFRIPNYHRLDVSATLYGKKFRKGKERVNRDYWVFGLYNVYARRNPFSIYFSQGSDRQPLGTPIETFATRVSVIGTVIPAVSYNFQF
jgi:hypothetical protein